MRGRKLQEVLEHRMSFLSPCPPVLPPLFPGMQRHFFLSARALGDSLIHRADSGMERLVNSTLWLLSNAKLPDFSMEFSGFSVE